MDGQHSSTADVDARSIYLFEDDRPLAMEIIAAFAAEGKKVELLTSQAQLVGVVRAAAASVLIMDRMVGETDMINSIQTLRAEGGRVPVLFISSLSNVDERIRGLKAGGDDYVSKPFAMGELIARVDALQRRSVEPTRTVLEVGPLSVDLIKRSARRGGRAIELLPREFALLEYLMRHADQVVTRSMLLEDVWNYHATTQTNVVDVHLGHLRKKVDVDGEPKLIHSVRGLGFKLCA